MNFLVYIPPKALSQEGQFQVRKCENEWSFLKNTKMDK